MKIKNVIIGKNSLNLIKPFITAHRNIVSVNEIIIKIVGENGKIGYGSAVPDIKVTGDTESSIISGIEIIANNIINMDVENIDAIMEIIDTTLVRNYSAKAAVDMAVYDLFCKVYNIPAYKLFGGYSKTINTDITISMNSPEEMVEDSIEAIMKGYKILKIKVGSDPEADVARVKAIRQAVRKNTSLRIDASQSWTPKQAVRIISKLEDLDLNIEFVEQPVRAEDIEGLKYVTDHVRTDILADEAVFTPKQALKLVEMRAADLINIKLIKCGGLHNAMKICDIAEINGVECMMGCLIESKIGVTAAASFAVGKKNVTKSDLDSLFLIEKDYIKGGVTLDENKIIVSEEPGYGIDSVEDFQVI